MPSFLSIDLLTYASTIDSIEGVLDNKNFKFVHGDICDEELVDKLFKEEGFDYVINFAAESHVDRSYLYEEVFYKGFREAYYFFERSNMIKEYEEE